MNEKKRFAHTTQEFNDMVYFALQTLVDVCLRVTGFTIRTEWVCQPIQSEWVGKLVGENVTSILSRR